MSLVSVMVKSVIIIWILPPALRPQQIKSDLGGRNAIYALKDVEKLSEKPVAGRDDKNVPLKEVCFSRVLPIFNNESYGIWGQMLSFHNTGKCDG